MPNEQASSAVHRLRVKARNVALGPNQKKSFGRGNRAGNAALRTWSSVHRRRWFRDIKIAPTKIGLSGNSQQEAEPSNTRLQSFNAVISTLVSRRAA